MTHINSDIAQIPSDQSVRLKAIDPSQSFAVSAPAGSGKTGLLTQRVLQLLASCDQPEEVLAITFTRKAAGEMQDRIVHALWQAAEETEPTDAHAQRTWKLAQAVLTRDAELGWHLLQSPHRLRVVSIDSFCRSITQQLPLASGLGAQPDILDNPELAYRLAVRELFKQLDQESPLREHLARLLRHLDNNLQTVESLLAGLLAKREQWLGTLLLARHQQARAYFESVLESVIREHLEVVTEILQLHGSELCAIADQAAQHLQKESERKNRIHTLLSICELPDPTPEAMPQWLALTDLLLTNTGSYRSRTTKAEGFPAGKEHAELKNRFSELITAIGDTHPEAEELIASIRQLPPAHYAVEQWQLLESLTQVLPQLVAELMLVFKQLAATDYSAISQAALLALGDEEQPSDLALQLDYRIRHILVDEFQDTASPQLELLKKLTRGWQNGDGRTLFIVGDGMQSCYGFRDANVGLFLDARQQGVGSVTLDAVDLCVNFRSQYGVVEWVNQVFAQAFPTQDDISRGAVKYSPSIAFKPALENPAVQVHIASYSKDANTTNTYNSDTDSDEEEELKNDSLQQARFQEAAKVVELVQHAQQQDPEGSIAILVRTRNHLESILPALNAADLAFQATDIDRLTSRMAIVDLRTLTRALLNPSDRIAWFSILRAPWCGLTLADLHAIAHFDLGDLSPRIENSYPVVWQQLRHYQRIVSLSPEGKILLGKILPVLETAWQQQYRKPLRQWIEGVWLALGGPACLLDTNDLENIQSYFTLLEKHQEAGAIKDWRTFDQAMEQLFAAPRADADARLQVMTIHKSKGLEFDTVIIPGLDRGNRSDDKELLLWQERLDHQGEKQLLLGSFAPVGNSSDPLYDFMRSENKKQQQLEATRLLYVGCTRAINHLHLLACAQQKDDAFKAPSKQTLLASIWNYVKDDVKHINASSLNKINNTVASSQAYLRLRIDWQLPQFKQPGLLQQYRGREYVSDINDNPLNLPNLETRSNRLARHTGTLIHSALEAIVNNQWLTKNNTPDDYIQQHRPLWQIQLRQSGWSSEEIVHAIQKISRALTNTLTDSKGRWILDHRHQDSACELALSQKDTQGIRELIIDRTFIVDGVRWIVDYKSSEPEMGESTEEFILRESAIYQLQLNNYKNAMSAMETNLIKTALYFVLPGILHELS